MITKIPAVLILGRSGARYSVIPAGMPVSSYKDVKLQSGTWLRSSTYAPDTLPSMALDSGIHAGMTGLQAKLRIADQDPDD